MIKFILRRVARGLVALLLFQSLLFGLIHALPFDFSSFILASPSWRQFIRQYLGLDRPFWEQYTRWLLDFVRLDMGKSYQYWPTPVSAILLNNLSRTLLLFLSAAIMAYLLGIWLGKTMAWRRGSLFELGATVGGIAAYTSFAPWLGFVMINVFGWRLGWLPYRRIANPNIWFKSPVTIDWLMARMVITASLALGALWLLWRTTRGVHTRYWRWTVRLLGLLVVGGVVYGTWAMSAVGHLAVDLLLHLTLPLGTVVLLSFGETMMLMRTAMLEELREDYVLMARAKGLPERQIRDRHAARNAILPVITRLVLNLPFVLVGSLVVERTFMWHAMGKVIFDAIEWVDIPVLLGVLSVVGMLVLTAHIVLDVLYVYLDPRVRYVGDN